MRRQVLIGFQRHTENINLKSSHATLKRTGIKNGNDTGRSHQHNHQRLGLEHILSPLKLYGVIFTIVSRFKSWLQVYHTCAHNCQHQCYVEELKQFNHQLPPRRVIKARGQGIRFIIANFPPSPPPRRMTILFWSVIYTCMTLLQTICERVSLKGSLNV